MGETLKVAIAIMYADPMVLLCSTLLLYRDHRRIGPSAIDDIMGLMYKGPPEALSVDCDIQCGSDTRIVVCELILKSAL